MINDYNYFKLRDLALLLSGTDKQFEVSWDDAEDRISLTTGTVYTKTGNEFNTSSSYQKAELTNADIFIDGKKASLSGYEIDNSNFFRLRDLGEALDFEVDWDNHSQTVIITTN